MKSFKIKFSKKNANDKMCDKDILKIVKIGKYGNRETRPLEKVLSLIEMEMFRIDPRVPQLFNPGLTSEELEEQNFKGAKYPHPDITALYSWHNGFRSGEVLGLFMNYHFPPLSEVLKYMEEMEPFAPEYFFTIMKDASGTTLDLDLRSKRRFKSLVIEGDIKLGVLGVYPGLNALFGAFLDALKKGIFKMEIGGGPQGEDVLVVKYEWLNKVFSGYQLQHPNNEDEYEYDEDHSFYDLEYKIILPAS